MNMSKPVAPEVEIVTQAGHPASLTVPPGDIGHVRQWLLENQAPIRNALLEHGSLYMHQLPMASVEDFAQVRDVLVRQLASYREQATPRSHFGAGVYSSTDFPSSQSIRPHNENSYTLTFPGLLVFGCLVAPESGGATPVTDVRSVLQQIPPALVKKFRERGWALIRNYAGHMGLSWTTAFATEDRKVVANYCDQNLIAHEWGSDGQLRTVQRRSAIITHPRSGEEVWFNHAVFWSEWSLDRDVREVLREDLGAGNLPFNTAMGDGEPICEDDIRLIDEAYRQATVRESWKPGDAMIIDNILAAHGRESFQGDRKIVVAMGEPVALSECHPTVPPLAGLPSNASGWRKLKRALRV
jgi:alpha-ketoglutarate-dependent taurine dioxygenase